MKFRWSGCSGNSPSGSSRTGQFSLSEGDGFDTSAVVDDENYEMQVGGESGAGGRGATATATAGGSIEMLERHLISLARANPGCI